MKGKNRRKEQADDSIDATAESGFLGRLVNHSRNGNLVTKAVEVNGRPHLILLAKQDLDLGTEILYDYGDRSKEALEHHPWLAS
ncbi:Histone-lysine N-methyltransferase pr-set7 [Portunus trituberculatus]|uniref:Histone-lysine N-methyltransferase pr-set7 n=1 Tax=Portunus trituberculatus TaxID=210409 RepID=A0A5B7GK67_PORTR|nr:Histone-lysine N-methyltransferase pr-set7 [Portunus trituberculatus]